MARRIQQRERRRIESFVKTRASWIDPEWAIRLREHTGGYELLTIESSKKTDVIFRLKEKAGSNQAIGRLQVTATSPPLVTELGLFPVPAGAKFEVVTLDAKARARVIAVVVSILDKFYVFPDVGKKLGATLQAREKRGTYNDLVDGEAFAARLTDDLRDISQDAHLEVRFSFVVQQPNQELAPTVALIFDLRDNHGGHAEMVSLIASYLFDEPTHLNDVYDRKTDTTTQSWTSPEVPGKKLTGKPVFLLTSKNTFSAAEDFSYALKNLKRGTLVGESTGGGAHMVEPHRLDDHFSLIVPFARSISPITKADWEGAGVNPDVRVRAADALAAALARARNGPRTSNNRWRGP